MIAQRARGAAPVVRAVAEDLPFADDSFDAAMAIITLHHWSDLNAEMVRVARRRVVVVTFEPDVNAARPQLLDGRAARTNRFRPRH